MEQMFYVYIHKDGDEVVYVGKGTGGRVLTTTGRLNKKHLSFMMEKLNRGDISFAEITHAGLSELDALVIERHIIQEKQPRFNRRYTARQAQKAKDVAMNATRASMKIVTTPDGVFESISAAARHYNVTPGAIWHRIKDKPEDYFYTKE